MQANTSKKVTVTWLRCKHYMYGHSKQSGRSGLDLVTFLQPKHAHLHAHLGFNNTRRVLGIKTSKPGLLRKASHHWTDIIPILTKVNVLSGHGTISVYSMHNSFTATSMLPIAGQRVFNVTNQIFIIKTQACCPRMESLKNFSSY